MAEDSILTGNMGPLILLFVIMGVIIMYAIVVSPAERERLLGPIAYERDAINTVPGEITPIPKTVYKLTHDLGIVEANFAPQAVLQSLSSQVTIKHSTLQDQDALFTVTVDSKDLAAASLNFRVAAKEGDKELIIELNKAIIFSGVLPRGPANISIPLAQLKSGANTIRISTAPPGVNLLTPTAYSLQDVAFVGQRYVPGSATATQSFTLATKELQGMTAAKFTGLAKKLGSPATLSLMLNSKSVYNASLFTDISFDLELPTSLLNASNTLTWEVSKGGDYQILFGQIKTTYTKTPFKVKGWTFTVTDLEKMAIDQGQRLNCPLNITATDLATQPLTVQINSYKLNLQLTNGSLGQDVCTYLQAGENYLSVQSDVAVIVSQIKLQMIGKAPGV